MVGQIIAHYRILSEIGSGGMGSVYRALDEQSGREVALKVLLRDHAADPDMRSRFLHEARAQAMIAHPNVAAFCEVGEDSGRVYIAMECITGPTLAEYVSHNELRPVDAVAIVMKIAEGLRAAHANGVIHRDLKPANIMLTPEGEPKITDFGLARFKGATTITKTGRIIGTARYMSPEQAEGRRVDHRSDLFSLGIILYELICRRVPFSGDNDTSVLYELLTREPQPLSRYASNVPAELERFISKALAKNPDERYQTAQEFVADLGEVAKRIKGHDDIHLKTGLSTRVRWRRRALYAAIVVLAAGGALVGRYLIQKELLEGSTRGLVVLPLRNIGSPEREYFTDGVTDEITTRLAGIPDLRVVSRTSSMRYKDSDKPIKAIASELKVDFVLEGAVRWADSGAGLRMHMTPHLIRVRDEQPIWAEVFDHRVEGVLSSQTQIAEAVVRAISTNLGREIALPPQALPTANVEAYSYFLRGSDYLNRGFDRSDFETAIMQFSRAVELDSTFAAAYARMSRAVSRYCWRFHRGDSACIAPAREAAAAARRLAPNLPETHLALGYTFYWGDRDFENALDEFEQVRALEPSNADAYSAIGFILRRMGRFEEAAARLRHAAELDALTSLRFFEVGNTYYHMRRCAEADSFFNRAIALAPDEYGPYSRKTLNYLHCDGSTSRARLFVDSALEHFSADDFIYQYYYMDCLDGAYDSALSRLKLAAMDSASYYLMAGRALEWDKRDAEARASYDSARVVLEGRLVLAPDDPNLLTDLGSAYAGLGRYEEAIRVARRAIALLPTSEDALGGPYLLEQLAEVEMRAGQEDGAISQLAIILASNNPLSKKTLQADPTWRPLWDNPRFRDLVE